MPLAITSPVFEHGGTIPTQHSRDGENLSPPLEWHGAPSDTRSFVLVVDDPDAPSGPSFIGRCTTSAPTHRSSPKEPVVSTFRRDKG